MSVIDTVTQGATPGAVYDLLQCDNFGGSVTATFRQGSSAHEALTAVSYSNSWVDFGGSLAAVKYYKDALGRVHLRGSAKSGTAGAAMFTLPSGYRPTGDRIFCIDANGTPCQLTITAAGVVTPAAGGGNTQISLDGVSFEI